MTVKQRMAFGKWHEDKINSGELFDFEKEMIDYCRSDVDILKQACLTFRKMLMKITGNFDLELDEEGQMNETLTEGLDPFNDTTIAGVCTKVFRTKFLEETWKVKLRQGDQLTDWIEASKLNGNLRVFQDGEWQSGKQLQERDYVIEESRFVMSKIAQIPSNGYNCVDQYSKISIQWMEWLMEKKRRQGEHCHIRHALNGGEVQLKGTKYRLDGYEAPSEAHPGGTAYEFLGCLWLGCPQCYPNRSLQMPRTRQSVNQLYEQTAKKRRFIGSLGMRYVAIWEHQFTKLLRVNSEASTFVENLDIQGRLDPRDAFFRGRTNAIKLKHSVAQGEKIHYVHVDFTSLYPFVNKYTKYPVGHPRIITNDFKDMTENFGIAKVKVLAPRHLFHPVLPQRM
ncbi:uncharacterized protein LOC117339819 [Pecten maximus]|uniref:uncharacterized protein LOC117339819 n=1 Tax=Pecten maximus TaxID=6579 RepID=UPI001458306F|nr:uncharacterized protein LOC117339819 [Pecten maximus]